MLLALLSPLLPLLNQRIAWHFHMLATANLTVDERGNVSQRLCDLLNERCEHLMNL